MVGLKQVLLAQQGCSFLPVLALAASLPRPAPQIVNNLFDALSKGAPGDGSQNLSNSTSTAVYVQDSLSDTTNIPPNTEPSPSVASGPQDPLTVQSTNKPKPANGRANRCDRDKEHRSAHRVESADLDQHIAEFRRKVAAAQDEFSKAQAKRRRTERRTEKKETEVAELLAKAEGVLGKKVEGPFGQEPRVKAILPPGWHCALTSTSTLKSRMGQPQVAPEKTSEESYVASGSSTAVSA
ncbi:hypothetical protein B0H10DRAFT_1937966 [Mycena sp. CBHHK59/15]|nr:hypothetical protein B0H10DRAFT_1937966 [Mycena sp. CBHHK59/15]